LLQRQYERAPHPVAERFAQALRAKADPG
jgi:hypothetical protein